MRGQNDCSISGARSESRASSSRCSAWATAACSAGRGPAVGGHRRDAYGDVSHWRTRLPIASASPFL